MKIGFDLISDLNLSPDDSFNWENKATSLYCLIAGNISSDLRTIGQTLLHLSKFYQGVFYTLGSLEFEGVDDLDGRINDVARICKKIRNVALLHHHVVIIDGIAVLGCNGWYSTSLTDDPLIHDQINNQRLDDFIYLKNSIEKLQKHLDVTKILMLTNSVPNQDLYFGEAPDNIDMLPELTMTLKVDSESKIKHWAYGTYKKIVDTTIHGINYVSNPYYRGNSYWAKRIDIEV